MWMPADVALWSAVVTGFAGWIVGRRAPVVPAGRLRQVAGLLRELAVVLVLYAAWRLLGEVTVMGTGGAFDRGLRLWHAEQRLHLPSELTLQRWTLHATWLARFANAYYIVAHVLPLGVFLVWLYYAHREHYRHWRNQLAASSLVCQVIQFVPLAPPRLYPALGFIDTGARFGPRVYEGTGLTDPGQLAAMPSMHVVWATVIGLAVWKVSRSRWRALGPAHTALTVFAVTVTAYHWLGDALVAMAIVATTETVAWLWSRRRPRGSRRTHTTAGPEAHVPQETDQGRAGAGNTVGTSCESRGPATLRRAHQPRDLVGWAHGSLRERSRSTG